MGKSRTSCLQSPPINSRFAPTKSWLLGKKTSHFHFSCKCALWGFAIMRLDSWFAPTSSLFEVKISLWIYFSNPPCIAHYKVDILCAYKVGFRSPLYIPTMGDKAVFCARNMPLDLEDDFIATLAFQFIPGWFPTRKRLNICGNAFYRPLVPFKEWP